MIKTKQTKKYNAIDINSTENFFQTTITTPTQLIRIVTDNDNGIKITVFDNAKTKTTIEHFNGIIDLKQLKEITEVKSC
jgi:hypothetical protein